MSADHILALDQGTTSSRGMILNQHGAIRGVAQKEFQQHFPQPGWVEHNAQDIVDTQLETARQAIKNARIEARHIAAIGITNQRETTVVWDRATGRPIAKAIVWQDRRTASTTDQMRRDGVEAQVTKITGLLLDPYFSATKIAWILDHVPGARSRAQKGELAAGTIDSWLLWNLTGGVVHATDVTNASRTLLLNLRTLDWDDEMLRLFHVPREVLPKVLPCDADFGVVPASVFGTEIPIRAMIGDQQSALFGQLCTRPGMAKNTFGTGCFMLMQVGEAAVQSKNRLLSTVAWQRKGAQANYAIEGSVFVGGSAIQWLRDGLGIIRSAADVNPLASSVADSGGVMVVPAFTGLGAPRWDPSARGIICGLTRGSTAAHIARATLEGIAHQVADLMQAMSADAGKPLNLLRVDGGASASDLLMQMQADLCGVAVERPKVVESTAQGAAFMAGLGVGLWSNPSQIEKVREIDRTFAPTWSADRRNASRSQWQRAVERCTKWDEGKAGS